MILVQSEFDLYQTSAKISFPLFPSETLFMTFYTLFDTILFGTRWYWVSMGQYWLVLSGTG